MGQGHARDKNFMSEELHVSPELAFLALMHKFGLELPDVAQ